MGVVKIKLQAKEDVFIILPEKFWIDSTRICSMLLSVAFWRIVGFIVPYALVIIGYIFKNKIGIHLQFIINQNEVTFVFENTVYVKLTPNITDVKDRWFMDPPDWFYRTSLFRRQALYLAQLYKQDLQ